MEKIFSVHLTIRPRTQYGLGGTVLQNHEGNMYLYQSATIILQQMKALYTSETGESKSINLKDSSLFRLVPIYPTYHEEAILRLLDSIIFSLNYIIPLARHRNKIPYFRRFKFASLASTYLSDVK